MKKRRMALRCGIKRGKWLQSFDQLRDVTARNLLLPALAAHLCTSVLASLKEMVTDTFPPNP